MKAFTALVGLVAAASAITITSPNASAQWDLSQTNTITWITVDSDTENFDILLVNRLASGQPNQTVATNVSPAAHSYDVSNLQVPNATYGYAFLFVGTDTKVNSGVIGNGALFNVTKSGTGSTGTTASTTAASPSKTSGAEMGRTFGVAAPLAALFSLLL